MKKLIQKIRIKLIHLLGGDIVSPLDKSPIKIIEYRPKIRTIWFNKVIPKSDIGLVPMCQIRNDLARSIAHQILDIIDIQKITDCKFSENVVVYRVKFDIIEGMEVREVSE